MVTKQPVAPELVALLIRIHGEVGSYRRMAEMAGAGPDVFSRVAGQRSGMSPDTCHKLARTFGEKYGFSEDDVLVWAGHRSGQRVALPAPSDVPSLVRELTPDLQMADARLTPGQVTTIRNILHNQIEMLIRLARDGQLPPTEYRPKEG